METNLTLKEKFLLLCYHPEKGRLLFNATYASYGVVGAIMLELAEMEKYTVENNRLFLKDNKPTGDEALDIVIARIARAKNNKKISTWISSIAQSSYTGKIKRAVRKSLIKHRILSVREKTALLFFNYKRYPARNTRTRRQLIDDIHNVVIKRQIGSRDIMLLTALVGATKMENAFFIREERKKARKRIKEIKKSNEIAKVLDSTITSVQAAVVTAITTTAVVSAATTN